MGDYADDFIERNEFLDHDDEPHPTAHQGRSMNMSIYNGHEITLVGEGQLTYCTRCKGGEVELDEQCIDRMTARLATSTARIAELEQQLAEAKAVVEAAQSVVGKTGIMKLTGRGSLDKLAVAMQVYAALANKE